MTPEQEISYIAAFIDGEGWVTKSRQVGFTNTNKELFDTVVAMFQRAGLNISTNFVQTTNPKHSNRWNARMVGGRQALERFSNLIPLQHPAKIARLAEIIAAYADNDANHRQRAKPQYGEGYLARRAEITRIANAKRWEGHVTKKPRQRPETPEQLARRALLARIRLLR